MFQLPALHQQKLSACLLMMTQPLKSCFSKVKTQETSKTPVYDLNGMQKSGISKGWNIVNGKKILIKLHSTLALPTAPNLSNSETNVFCK